MGSAPVPCITSTEQLVRLGGRTADECTDGKDPTGKGIGGRSNGETCCWVTLDECVWMMMDGCMVGWVRGGGGGNGGTKSLEDKTDDVHVAG